MNKFSKREQFLLLVLGFIVIFVLFYVLIWTPTQSSKLELNAEKNRLESEKMAMDMKLPLLGKLESDLKNGMIDIEKQLDLIEDNLDAARFERWFFPLLKNKNVTVLSSSFTQPVVASPDASFYVKNDPMYRVKEMIDGINNLSSVPKTKPVTESVLLKSTYEYQLSCSYNMFASILDEITKWNTTFFVNGADYNFESNTAKIRIDGYTIDKFEITNDERYEGDYSKDGLNTPADLESEGSNNGGFIDNNHNNIDDREENDNKPEGPITQEPKPDEINPFPFDPDNNGNSKQS